MRSNGEWRGPSGCSPPSHARGSPTDSWCITYCRSRSSAMISTVNGQLDGQGATTPTDDLAHSRPPETDGAFLSPVLRHASAFNPITGPIVPILECAAQSRNWTLQRQASPACTVPTTAKRCASWRQSPSSDSCRLSRGSCPRCFPPRPMAWRLNAPSEEQRDGATPHIAQRRLEHATTKPNGPSATEVELPVGSHRVTPSIADASSRTAARTFRFSVAR